MLIMIVTIIRIILENSNILIVWMRLVVTGQPLVEWVSEWVSERVSEWVSEWVSEGGREVVIKWVSEFYCAIIVNTWREFQKEND